MKKNYGKRGMLFEDLLNKTNKFYLESNQCCIYKKPTPIKILKMNNNKITEAIFSEKSTTDYNGVYEGYYIDFEAKQTSSDYFDFNNIKSHQLNHLTTVIKMGGISFILIFFKPHHTTFLVKPDQIPSKKKIPYSYFLENYIKIDTDIYVHYINYLKEVCND